MLKKTEMSKRHLEARKHVLALSENEVEFKQLLERLGIQGHIEPAELVYLVKVERTRRALEHVKKIRAQELELAQLSLASSKVEKPHALLFYSLPEEQRAHLMDLYQRWRRQGKLYAWYKTILFFLQALQGIIFARFEASKTNKRV